MKKGGKKVHFLDKKTIDTQNKTANCSKCGKIKILKHQKGWRCSVSHKNGKHWNKYHFTLPKKIITFGKCQICKKDKKLQIDHCHKRNIFRGFICLTCNTLLGFAYDDIKILHQAIKYLKK